MVPPEKSLLRFITCGSVDDGKSTLIGRLLYDSRLIQDDQLEALERDSRRHGTVNGGLDLALLLDGLEAEREQAITIDVAYRFFETPRRKFIVADTPGHVQYTRNMATGASTASLAIVLVDARKGVLTQTRRHVTVLSLLGVRTLMLAINKMDLVEYDRAQFETIVSEFRQFGERLGISEITAIPISALHGDNITAMSAAAPWYKGPSVLSYLETVNVGSDPPGGALRMPVQWVNRAGPDFRGYAGMIVRGIARTGDKVVVQPSGKASLIKDILLNGAPVPAAGAGRSVTLTFADNIDIGRGDVICAAEDPATATDQVAAHLIWMHDEPMLPGRRYIARVGTAQATAQITELKHKIGIDSLDHQAAKVLALNEIGLCNLSFDRRLAFDPYKQCRDVGSFVLIDRLTNLTLGAGMVEFSLHRAANVVWQHLEVDKQRRSQIKGQRPCVLWFTGLSGSGKSTIANLVETQLTATGRHTYLLDGDNIRHGLNRDLGFTDADRVENIRRVAETARLMVDAGLIVLVSFISPFRRERQLARDLMEEGEFLEVYVNTPLEICEARDPKGLYRRARLGEIPNFTGISSPYEPPEAPDVVIDGNGDDPDVAARALIDELRRRGLVL